MTTAQWNDAILADSDDTVVVEGNHYFPRSSLDQSKFEPSDKTSFCPWKGTAHYMTVVVDGQRNQNAAWYYPEPKSAAASIADRIAFWNGISVV